MDHPNGIVLVDKPSGMTSHDVSRVKQRLERSGQSLRTLDSSVTGVLLVAVNEARKAMPVLMGLDKTYTGTMDLHKKIDRKNLEKICKSFVGKITQTPPVKSRVVRKPRERIVYSFDIIDQKDRDVRFRVCCQAGTYIRKLVHDIGLKVGGAHMTQLRRTNVGPFTEREITPLERLSPENIIPLEKALQKIELKRIVISSNSVGRIRNGRPVHKQDLENMDRTIKPEEIIGIFNSDGKILALGKALLREDLIAVPNRVFKT